MHKDILTTRGQQKKLKSCYKVKTLLLWTSKQLKHRLTLALISFVKEILLSPRSVYLYVCLFVSKIAQKQSPWKDAVWLRGDPIELWCGSESGGGGGGSRKVFYLFLYHCEIFNICPDFLENNLWILICWTFTHVVSKGVLNFNHSSELSLDFVNPVAFPVSSTHLLSLTNVTHTFSYCWNICKAYLFYLCFTNASFETCIANLHVCGVFFFTAFFLVPPVDRRRSVNVYRHLFFYVYDN